MQKGKNTPPFRKPDSVEEIYCIAEAVRHLADTLPDSHKGLSYLLGLVSREAKHQAETLDDDERSGR